MTSRSLRPGTRLLALFVLSAAASNGQEDRAQPAASAAWSTARPAELGLWPELRDGVWRTVLSAFE